MSDERYFPFHSAPWLIITLSLLNLECYITNSMGAGVELMAIATFTSRIRLELVRSSARGLFFSGKNSASRSYDVVLTSTLFSFSSYSLFIPLLRILLKPTEPRNSRICESLKTGRWRKICSENETEFYVWFRLRLNVWFGWERSCNHQTIQCRRR